MMENNSLEDYGKSLVLANQLETIKIVVIEMDQKHLNATANKLIDQGNWQDSAAILNPGYDLDKSDLLRVQGETLRHLTQFIDGLKKCQALKDKISSTANSRSQIMNMFL